jgi:hypothetical protein
MQALRVLALRQGCRLEECLNGHRACLLDRAQRQSATEKVPEQYRALVLEQSTHLQVTLFERVALRDRQPVASGQQHL